jgi:hypothetical protein
MSIRNNDIGPTTVFSQNFSYPLTGGLPQSFFPGANTTVLANAGNAGRISSTGAWTVFSETAGGENFSPPVCGQTRNGYLVASLVCAPTGIAPGTNAMFTLRPATLKIAPGTYTGSVDATPGQPGSPNNPAVPWTGTTGTVTLTVAGGTITGSASLAPVNPQTGFPVAGPPVAVSYGPVSISGGASVPASGGASIATGLVTLPSTPSGYSLCGGFLTNGLVIGVTPCGGGTGAPGPANYVAATFEASSAGSYSSR